MSIQRIDLSEIPNELRSWVKKHADNTFEVNVPFDLIKNILPKIEGWCYNRYSPIALRLRNVAPHTDECVSSGHESRSLFFITSKPDRVSDSFSLVCGGDYAKIEFGFGYFFNDQELHCVVSDRLWYGVAIQLHEDDGYRSSKK